MADVIFASGDSIAVDRVRMELIKEAALQSPLGRARFCLHPSHADPMQEMVIAIRKGSLIAPHRQPGKSKSYWLIEGELSVLFFDHSGHETRRVVLGPAGGPRAFLYRFPAGEWHTVLPASEMVVYVETICGPYRREETEFADWDYGENGASEVLL